jgi:hypothetical protein
MHSFTQGLLVLGTLAGWSAAAVTAAAPKQTELPVLKLDYGSFRATAYDKAKDVRNTVFSACWFSN